MEKIIFKILKVIVYPFVPLKKRLPFDYWLLRSFGSIEDELRYIDRIKCNFDTAIDVGANQGLYSYNFSKRFKRVYSFEVNKDLTTELDAYNPGNVNVINEGLSSRVGKAILYIPVSNGLPLTGWASLAPGNAPGIYEHIEKPVKINTLDSFNLDSVSFIKIDVEGHEVEVIKGAYQTLFRNRPVVLVEVKENNRGVILKLFEELNYSKKSLLELTGKVGSEENYIFVPNN